MKKQPKRRGTLLEAEFAVLFAELDDPSLEPPGLVEIIPSKPQQTVEEADIESSAWYRRFIRQFWGLPQ